MLGCLVASFRKFVPRLSLAPTRAGCFWCLLWLLPLTPTSRAEFLPALLIREGEIANPPTYARLVARANVAMRTKHQVPLFLRAYAAISPVDPQRAAFALWPGATAEAVRTNQQLFATAPDLADLARQLSSAGPTGPETSLQAVRFDGTHTPGWLINTRVQTNDESALLARVAILATRLSPPGQPKPLINVFRVASAAATFTHLVSINTASAAELARQHAALTAGDEPLAFTDPAGPRCTIIDRTPYRELSANPE